MVWILLGAPGAGKGTQAVKLAAHLGKRHAGHTLYLINEPTLMRHVLQDNAAELYKIPV